MTNLEQARALFEPIPRKIRGHEGFNCGTQRCVETHLIGVLNPARFGHDDVLWGPQASGSLFGEWDIHEYRYNRLYGSFPMPDGGTITEDYAELLKEPIL